jgi:outer membrane putative beta-barrel porin/alpha-amylase
MSCCKFAVTHIRNNRSKAFIIAVTLAAFVPASAQSRPQQDLVAQPQSAAESDLINADRPGIADGSTVIGPKRLQIESGIQLEFRRSGDGREHTFFIPTLLRFGIDSNWEVRIEGNTFTRVTTFDSTNTVSHTSGLAPASVGFKYHIYNSNGDQQLSLGTIVRVFPAWGSKEFRMQHTTGDIRLAADWSLAPSLSINPNIGVGRYEDDKGRLFTATLFAITLNYLPNKKVNPFIDLGVQYPEANNGKTAAILDSGIAYIIGRNLQIDASIGTRAHGDTTPQPFLGFGISWRSKLSSRGK